MKITTYKMTNDNIGAGMKITTPISNVVQAGSYWYNNIQQGFASALQLHKDSIYYYMTGFEGGNVSFTDSNRSCLITDKMYGHTQSVAQEDTLFDHHTWIGSGPTTYKTKNENWGLDVICYDDNQAPLVINKPNDKIRIYTNWQEALNDCLYRYLIIYDEYKLTRVEFTLHDYYLAVMLFGKGNNQSITIIALYNMDTLKSLTPDSHKPYFYDMTYAHPDFVYSISDKEWQDIQAKLPAEPLHKVPSIQGFTIKNNMIYLSSQYGPSGVISGHARFIFTWDILNTGTNSKSNFDIYDFSATTDMDQLGNITEFENLLWNDNILMLHVAHHKDLYPDYPTINNYIYNIYL